MQKKMMAVAVAGALGAPAIALAQGASTVQVYGTIYLEYAYVDQGTQGTGALGLPAVNGDYVKADILQTPGSEIGFRGEEKLGGNLSAWFQCNSTFDVRGSDPQGFCGRNSAVGLKGGFGNIYFGNWDTPFKRTTGMNRLTNETGVWGASFLLTGAASSYNANATGASFSRRQNSTVFYDSPNWNGFTVNAAISTLSGVSNTLDSATGVKPRVYSINAGYNAGGWNIGAAYEMHQNFGSGLGYSGDDSGWAVTGGYTFKSIGLRLGAIYSSYKWDLPSGDGKVWTTHLAADWNISGPHSLIAGWTYADDTEGSAGTAVAPVTNAGLGSTTNARVFNGGAGNTAASLYQISYQYAMSKRTAVRVGYVWLTQDDIARYSLGGAARPAGGETQQAIGVSVRHTF
jgi:predicted porin